MQASPRIAIVTGGSRGIGAAVAVKLASQGLAVAIIYQHNAQAAEQVLERIRAAGGVAEAFAADVSDEASVKAAMTLIVERFGQVDALVNCAGMLEMRTLAEMDAASVARAFNVNFNSVIYMVQNALPHFPLRGGRIVNFSTNLIYQPRLGSGLYAASKAAVSVLTNALAKELGPRGITVNAVAPSMTRTDMTAATPPARREAVMAATPLGRIGEPEDVADVVAFLASDESRWVTGRTLLTDGGLTDAL
ncbi:MAG: glucose 1-dehydrogenase [Curvibacter lanceolatus]|jgi:3-oxoacyl-[acyl-carrier protein] reductase|uniref:SDR family NAD(P)-dependent oxidoreductase n=1 Tax=Curvibacter lanceolatus TaxID=86182 RepID=UPI0003690C87|nr:glucose 1-dehydrogenase [Curvibacter lanceolatus]MBV5294770.1 glucose 1-dehydrogenase [Curvibacter lanceolatus]